MSLPTSLLAGTQAATADFDQPDALRFLDEHLARGGLDRSGYDELHKILAMLDEISLLLFPPKASTEE